MAVNSLFRLITFLLWCTLGAFPSTAKTAEGVAPYCGIDSVATARLVEKAIPVKLTVQFRNYRKWQKNSLKIIRSRSENILAKHKKRHKAFIEAEFANGLVCRFKAKVRQSGDWKDNIKFIDGNLLSSLDVHLNNSHINNFTNFKLFIPEIRNGDSEIIFVEILKYLGFIAPTSYLIDVTIGDFTTKMLLQEKQSKELIETNKRREGPLFEGNETLFWSQNEGGWGLTGRGKISFSRLVNHKWARRGNTSLKIALAAQSTLNRIFASSYKNAQMAQGGYFKHYLNPDLLANKNAAQTKMIEIFDALMYAAGAAHGLGLHNRKFYYDAIYEYFEPVYYDGNINFFGQLQEELISPSIKAGSAPARELLSRLALAPFRGRLEALGVQVSLRELKAIFTQLDRNLQTASRASILAPRVTGVSDIRSYLASLPDTYEDVRFAYVAASEEMVQFCDQSGKSCEYQRLDRDDIGRLLAGKFEYGRYHVMFTESEPSVIENIETRFFKAGKSRFKYLKSADTVLDIGDDTLQVTFKTPRDWLVILGGQIGDLLITVKGQRLQNNAVHSGSQRFNERLLTGCLSFVDTKFQDTRIHSKSSHCEDAVNIIRGEGSIAEIRVEDALSDGVDIDFSHLNIKKTVVSRAGNDCIDVSAGTYKLEEVQVTDCADKGLSVGEGSVVTAARISAQKAKIGLAVKDSSEVQARQLDLGDTQSCIHAYRKKQEFVGGSVHYDHTTCSSSDFKQDPGSLISSSMQN